MSEKQDKQGQGKNPILTALEYGTGMKKPVSEGGFCVGLGEGTPQARPWQDGI